ncbi:MAG: polymerase sigma factor [Bacilli bacterium]|nr:polymerase sigma factor [Bacilli bacterium]
MHTLQNPERLGSWLYAIVRRLSLNALRVKAQNSPLEEAAHLQSYEWVEELVLQRDMQRQIYEALNMLEETQRLAITLYYIGGLTIKETAAFLNISVDAAESRIRRSRISLKKELIILMEHISKKDELKQNIEREVMRALVPRISTIEIPVSDLRRAVDWYGDMLGAKLNTEWQDNWTSAMLHLQGGEGMIGVPSLFLVQTEDKRRLTFHNTKHSYIQSVIDLYTNDLQGYYHYLKDRDVDVNEIDWIKEPQRIGFGFRDLDGNSLGVCNIELTGQGGGLTINPDAHPYIWRVAGVEIPVSDLKKAVVWYAEIFGMKVLGELKDDWEAAMLYLDGGERIGVPNFYLVETADEQRLAFVNSNTNITHSVIDFYSSNVNLMLTDLRVRKVQLNGTSGFFDPDGNSLAVCNAVHQGQVQKE